MQYRIVLTHKAGAVAEYVKLTESESQDKVDELYKEYGDGIESCEIFVERLSEEKVEYVSLWSSPEFRRIMVLPKDSLALKLIKNSKENIHLSQLRAFLTALEFENIDELMLQEVDYFSALGDHLKTHIQLADAATMIIVGSNETDEM